MFFYGNTELQKRLDKPLDAPTKLLNKDAQGVFYLEF
jgi:hypothetical protein